MVLQTPSSTPKEIFYPDCDGQPLANNTEQEQERQRAEVAEKSLQAAIAKLLTLGMTQSQVAETLSLPIETVQALAIDR